MSTVAPAAAAAPQSYYGNDSRNNAYLLANLTFSGRRGTETYPAYSYDLRGSYHSLFSAMREARDRAQNANYNQAQAVVQARDGNYLIGTVNTPSRNSPTGWQGLMIDGPYFDRNYDSVRGYREHSALRAIVGADSSIRWDGYNNWNY